MTVLALIDGLWKTAAILLLARAGIRLASSSQLRHLIGVVALGATLVVPWAGGLVPESRRAVIGGGWIAPQVSVDGTRGVTAGSALPEPVSAERLPWGQMAFGAWLVGSVLLAAAFAGRHLALGRGLRESMPAGERIEAAARCAAGRQGLARTPEVRRSRRARVPYVLGGWRGVVVLPADAVAWSDTRLDLVLQHEMAHVRRRDPAAVLLGQLACVAHWPLPLVWTFVRRLELEREHAADDAVLQAGALASQYARELLALALQLGGRQQPAPVAMVRRRPVETRLRAILDPQRPRKGTTAMTRTTLFVMTLAVVLVLLPLRLLASPGGAAEPPEPPPAPAAPEPLSAPAAPEPPPAPPAAEPPPAPDAPEPPEPAPSAMTELSPPSPPKAPAPPAPAATPRPAAVPAPAAAPRPPEPARAPRPDPRPDAPSPPHHGS